MAFLPQEPFAIAQAIAETSTGTTPVTGVTFYPQTFGQIVRAYDPVTYGFGEFIYLKGVASTVVGSAVVWDSTFQTALTLAASRGPVAISMSINVANQGGWYQISGIGQAISNGAVASGVALQSSANGGQIDDTTTAGQYIEGAVSKGTAGGAAALFTVALSRPCANGR